MTSYFYLSLYRRTPNLLCFRCELTHLISSESTLLDTNDCFCELGGICSGFAMTFELDNKVDFARPGFEFNPPFVSKS